MPIDKAIQAAKFGGDRILNTYTKYQKFLPAVSFGGGILFDVLTLGRIDQMSSIVQSGIYLLLIALMIGVEAHDKRLTIEPPAFLKKIWHLRTEVTHFFLGSLLSVFTIYFLKSGTVVSSFFFLALIAGALVANEFSGFREFGLVMRVVLFSVCLISFFVTVVPIAWGRIGVIQFLVSLISASIIFSGFVWVLLKRKFEIEWLKKQIIYPFSTATVGFAILYGLGAIPPVPLSLTHFGIYRSVDRLDGNYKVTFARPSWKFWQSGDQSFAYKSGDRIYCFFSVFSPGGFQEKIKVRWLSYSATAGWEKSDAVPVSISGGREQGYRGFAYKQSVRPGLWQVRIETNDDREIGRLNFEIIAEEDGATRDLKEKIL